MTKIKKKSKKPINTLKIKKIKKIQKAKAKTPPKAEKLDPRVERIYEEWIERLCPKTGKKIKQKVKIVRYKPLSEQVEKHVVPTTSVDTELEKLDDGLHIYSQDDKE